MNQRLLDLLTPTSHKRAAIIAKPIRLPFNLKAKNALREKGKRKCNGARPRALFICGSRNQTTQLHQVASCLPDFDQAFTPYFMDGIYELAREMGLMDFTIAGGHWREECLQYLRDHDLPIDVRGAAHHYDLIVTCQDLVLPRITQHAYTVLVQEGMVDPVNLGFHLVRKFNGLPRWLASTAATGLSNGFDRFCVASEGFRQLFVNRGVNPDKLVVTGIPNFSQCDGFRNNTFPHRGFLLVCTSDSRETFKIHDRRKFLLRAKELAAGRHIIVKLHPNELHDRATAEVRLLLPGATVLTTGHTEQMIANCDILLTEWSSTALVGLALGKTVYSNFEIGELKSLMPLQTPHAAENIAAVCRAGVYGISQPEAISAHSTRDGHRVNERQPLQVSA